MPGHRTGVKHGHGAPPDHRRPGVRALALGSAFGSGIGAVIGASSSSWQPVYTRPDSPVLTAYVQPAAGAVHLGAGLGF